MNFERLSKSILLLRLQLIKTKKIDIMKNLWLVIILAAIVSGFSACDDGISSANLGGESAANNVPEDASAVVAINLKSLMGKADMDVMKKMAFYEDMVAESARQQGETMAKVLENPEKSGIDLNQNAYFFMDIDGKDENGLIGFVFTISDKGQFEDLVNESDMEANESNGFQYASNNQSVVAWNGSIGFIGVISNSYDKRVDVEIQLDKVFNNRSSITNNSDARKALGGNHDMNYYFSTSKLVDMFSEELAMGEFFINKEDLKNNSFTGYTDFNEGEIESIGYSDLSKGLKSSLKMIFGEGSETDFSPYISKENLVMLTTGKLNFKGINQLLKNKGLNGFADMGLLEYGLKTDDIMTAIDGDIAIAMNMKAEGDEPVMTMTMKINDKKKLEMILNKAKKLGLFTKISDGRYMVNYNGFGIPIGEILIQRDILIFSNDTMILNKLENGKLSKSERISSSTYKNMNGVLGMFMDYEGFTKRMGDMPGMSSISMNGSVSRMENSIGWEKSTSKIKMKNKSQNSLQSLIEGINDAYLENEDMRDRMRKETEVESVEIEM
ncbi:MAG: hypothetical protein ACI97N_002201 [Cognaticolwellia sp.]